MPLGFRGVFSYGNEIDRIGDGGRRGADSFPGGRSLELARLRRRVAPVCTRLQRVRSRPAQRRGHRRRRRRSRRIADRRCRELHRHAPISRTDGVARDHRRLHGHFAAPRRDRGGAWRPRARGRAGRNTRRQRGGRARRSVRSPRRPPYGRGRGLRGPARAAAAAPADRRTGSAGLASGACSCAAGRRPAVARRGAGRRGIPAAGGSARIDNCVHADEGCCARESRSTTFTLNRAPSWAGAGRGAPS
jgi:hypothetical protein